MIEALAMIAGGIAVLLALVVFSLCALFCVVDRAAEWEDEKLQNDRRDLPTKGNPYDYF
jgi:hypothetical protein